MRSNMFVATQGHNSQNETVTLGAADTVGTGDVCPSVTPKSERRRKA